MKKTIITLFILALLSCKPNKATTEYVRLSGIDSVCTLTFSGDIMLHMGQLTPTKRGDTYNFDSFFKYISPIWEKADFSIANLETTISHDGRYSGYPGFSSPAQIVDALKNNGVDVVALANNHILDRRYKGAISTLKTIDSLGLMSVGCNSETGLGANLLILKKDNFRVGLLNYTYSTNGIPTPKGINVNRIDTALIKDEIDYLKIQRATHIIIFIHWGNEYQTYASAEQKKLALWFKQQGVDVVIGSHPHVIQPIDTANNIVYSLGNFVSNQTKPYRDCGLTVEVTLYNDMRKSKINPTIHWVDWMRASTDTLKYQVLTIKDTLHASNKKYMIEAIKNSQKIID